MLLGIQRGDELYSTKYRKEEPMRKITPTVMLALALVLSLGWTAPSAVAQPIEMCEALEVTKTVSPSTIECIDSCTDTGTDTGTDCGIDECICPCEDGNSGTDVPPVFECIANKVTYTYTVTNNGDLVLINVVVFDDQLGIIAEFAGLGPGASETITIEDVCLCENTINEVTVTAELVEGCTPGYWKQGHHFDSWPASYTPNTLFSDVFEDAFPGLTLLDALKLRGGGLNALGRHTVAALLNGASPDVAYGLTETAVIAAFNDIYPGSKKQYNILKDFFEDFNEHDCPFGNTFNGNICTATDMAEVEADLQCIDDGTDR